MINWTVCQNDRQANKEISPCLQEKFSTKKKLYQKYVTVRLVPSMWELGEKDEKAALIDDVFLLSWVE